MKKLYLITDTFPYGTAEKTFLMPELMEISKNFDVTLISSGAYENSCKDFLNSKTIKVDKYESFFLLKYVFNVLFHKQFWRELFDVVSTRKYVWARIKQTVWFYCEAISFSKWMEKNHYIDKSALYYTYWYNAKTLGLCFLKDRKNIKHAITRAHSHDLYDYVNKNDRQISKKYMDKVLDAVIFISNEGRDYYLASIGISLDRRHKVFRLGVRGKDKIVPAIDINIRRDKMLIVSCSSLISRKRVNLIIEALALVDGYYVEWVHFGDGEMRTEIEELADKRLGKKHNIKYCIAGYTDNNSIISYYCANHPNCYLLVSSAEGLPVANMEALSCGIPIITSDVGGCSETIRDNGILLDSNPTPTDIAGALLSLRMVSDEKYNSMCMNSYKLWKERFDSDVNYKAFAEYLMQIV